MNVNITVLHLLYLNVTIINDLSLNKSIKYLLVNIMIP